MADQAELYQQIGQALVDELPEDGWESVEVTCYMVTIVTEFRGTLVRSGGEEDFTPPAAAIYFPFKQLREETYEPGKGAWFTATFRMSATGSFSIDYDYESKPDLRPEPLDETWFDDLEKYPRDPELIPAWMPRPDR